MHAQVQLNARRALKRKSAWLGYWKYRNLTLMLLPGIAYYFIFHYIPIYGVLIAFKDYTFLDGIWGSRWVGLDNFHLLWSRNSFWEVFRNTMIINGYKLLFGFPAPILFALLLNELRLVFFKRVVQSISYLPHFLSWVILSGVLMEFLSPSTGPINIVLKSIGLKPIYFLADVHWFRSVLVASEIWKDLGWGTIVYLAALTAVSPELYDAARVDGAGRLQRVWHVTLPSLVPVMTIMLIFAVGKLANDDFDQVFNLYNPAVYKVGDVIGTYTYRSGLLDMQYSFATAVGLFKNVIALVLVVSANAITKRINEYGLW